MKIKPLRLDLEKYLQKHNLTKKYQKCCDLFVLNPLYPSLNTELLEPRHIGIYSFRLDKKYRVLFIYIGNQEIEIIAFTNHYK